MIGFSIRTQSDVERVKRKARQGTFRSLSHAAAAVRLTASRSIRRRKGPSQPGQPPHTRRGQLKRAIRYAVDRVRETAVIGPSYEAVADVGMPHEFGGRYRRDRYRPRPFMGPALAKVRDRLPRMWAASVR